MSNNQDKKLGLGALVIAILVATLFVFYHHDVNALDQQVVCFSEEQLDQIEADVLNAVRDAYDYGHTEGMTDALDTMTKQIADHCATAKPEDAFILMPDGLVLACPAK